MLDKLIKEVIDWNTNFLPDNTLNMQLRKVMEEIREVIKAKNSKEYMAEWADLLISVIGIKRFSEQEFYVHMGFLIECDRPNLNEIVEESFKKLEVNKRRKWVIKNGVYHHEEVN